MSFNRQRAALLLLAGLAACAPGERPAARRVVVAAVGEPPAVLPPLTYESVGRDVGDLVWERLASPCDDPAATKATTGRPLTG